MSGFSDGAWSVVKKAATWACYGAVAVGAFAVLPAAGISIISGSWAATTLGTALMYGAGIGGLFGTIAGIAGAPEAAQAASDDRHYRQRENLAARENALAVRAQRMQMAQNQAQAPADNSLTPNVGFGQTQTQGIGV